MAFFQLPEALDIRLCSLANDLQHKLFFGGEVVVNRPLSHVDRCRDVANAGTVVALFANQAHASVYERLAGLKVGPLINPFSFQICTSRIAL